MTKNIWGLLEDYEGKWVAVDRAGQIVAHAPTLPEVMSSAGKAVRRLTFLYAAAKSAGAASSESSAMSIA